MKLINIKHDKYGVVEGASMGYECWHKNGAMYCKSQGWSQVPEIEWVTIQVRKSQWDNVNNCCNVLEVQKKSEDYPDTCTLSWRYPQ